MYDNDDVVVVEYGDCEGIKDTGSALLVRFPNGKIRWIPQSVIAEESEVYQEDTEGGTLVVAAWWADVNDLDAIAASVVKVSGEELLGEEEESI